MLLLAGGAALGTPAAFQRVWLPLASASLGGHWQSESGRVSLLGAVEVSRLKVELEDLTAAVEHAALRVLPWASLRAAAPALESLELRGVDLRIEAAEPRADDSDPCAKYAEQLEKMGNRDSEPGE